MAKQKVVPTPDTHILDKVHFVFNNLSPTNLEQKERDMLAALPEHFTPWLCQVFSFFFFLALSGTEFFFFAICSPPCLATTRPGSVRYGVYLLYWYKKCKY
jgi:hypothetical protein